MLTTAPRVRRPSDEISSVSPSAETSAAGSERSFQQAGKMGVDLLTHLFDQDVETLARKVTLYVDADSEGVAAAVARVSHRRVEYITTILVDMGFDRAEAARRATITLATVLGLLQLRAATGDEFAVLDDTALVRTAFDMAITR